jgi:Tol biopolymer transport system component
MAVRQNPKIFSSSQNHRNLILKPTKSFGLKTEGEDVGIMSGRLSPDGKMIAYSVISGSQSENILVKVLETDYVQPLTKDSNENWCPLWSADGSEVAFLSNRGGQTGLWKVHHLGGAATLMYSFTPPTAGAAQSKPWLCSWSDDGRTIYYSWDENVFALDIDSKGVSPLTHFDPAKSSVRNFQLSPDKEWIAYNNRKNGQTDIWKVPAKGGAPVQLTNDPIVEGQPVWSSDGKSLIYAASQDGLHEIKMLDVESTQVVSLLSGMEAGEIEDITRDTSKLLYRIRKDESDLWKVKVASGEDQKITAELGVEFWPDISPNGETIAFQAVKGSNFLIDPKRCLILTQALAPGSQAAQITSSASQAQWSPDAKSLAFLLDEKGVANLRVVQSIGGEARQVTEGGVSVSGFTPVPYNHRNDYSWSPNSSRLAYISRKEEARNLWVTNADGSGEVKLSNYTDASLFLSGPRWSADGKQIAYISNDGDNPQHGSQRFTLWVINLENPQNPEVLFETDSFMNLVGWSGENELIIALVDKHERNIVEPVSVDLYRIDGKTSQKLTFFKAAYFYNLSLSPDKKSIAFVAIQDKKSNIYTYALKGGEIKQLTRNIDPAIYFSSLVWSPDGTFLCYGRQERTDAFTIIEGLQ